MTLSVVFMGTPDFAVPSLEALNTAFSVSAVYCKAPSQAGRGKKLRPCPVHETADRFGIPVHTPKSLRQPPEVQEELRALAPHVIVVAAYGLILPQAVLDIPQLGCINIHASLLPRWRGAAPIHRAVMAGDRETGVTIMRMEAGLDTGPMLMDGRIPIRPQDTTGDVHDHLAVMGSELIVHALNKLMGGRLPDRPQPKTGITYAEKVDKREAELQWDLSATDLDRQIRGLSPFPGAWCPGPDGSRIKVLRSAVETTAEDRGHLPGEILTPSPNGSPRVACGDGGVLELRTLQRQGKAAMDGSTFLRGYALPVGSFLGSP